MHTYIRKNVTFLFLCLLLSITITVTASAKTTFLPDWEEEPYDFDGGEDYNLCERSTDPVYHYAPGSNKCPSPKIYDHTCPHSSDWISECYCPSSYNQTCSTPYVGIGQSCDGKYESCCDPRCREGSTASCSYPYVTDYTSTTECGQTCYVCRYGNDCNTSCSPDETATPTGSTNDYNGEACVTCAPQCTPKASESGCTCGTYSCSDECGGTRTCCTPCPETPSCTETCASKGYQTAQPSGQTCSTTTVCGETCYYDCQSDCTYTYTAADCNAECKNVGTSSCIRDGITYYETCGSSKCKDGETCSEGQCVSTCTDTCSSKGYQTSQPGGYTCSTTSVCGQTCYKDCVCATTCEDKVTSKPANSSYTTESCTACGSTKTINTGWTCNDGYEKSGNSCVEQCTDTCSSKGYKTSQPSGQTCSTTTVCGQTCYYDCKSDCTYNLSEGYCRGVCRDVGSVSCTRNGTTYYQSCGNYKCSSGQSCISGNCVSDDPCDNKTAVSVPANASCSSYYSDCPDKCAAWTCNSGYEKSGTSCVKKTCTNTCFYTLRSCPANGYCKSCQIIGSDCSVASGGTRYSLVSCHNGTYISFSGDSCVKY